MNQRLAGAGGTCRIGRDRREAVIVDVDQFGGVLGLNRGFGDDEGDVIADMADAVLAEHGTVGVMPALPSRFSIGMMQGSSFAPWAVMSSGRMTARTPGAALAASTSIDVILAWASSERTATP